MRAAPHLLRRFVAVVPTAALIAVGAFACSTEPERSVANYCGQIEALQTLDDDLASGDPVRIQARAEDLRLLQMVAPDDIEPSVTVLLGVTDDFARTAGTASDRARVPAVVFQGRSDDIEAIEAAGTTVTSYTLANCRIDLSGGSTSIPASSPGSGGTDPDPVPVDPAVPTTTTTSTPSLLVD